MKLRNLYLHGDLAKVYGKKHRVFANTFRDALRIVDCNHPGFLRRVIRGNWHCLRGDRTMKRSHEMAEHHVGMPISGDFHLVPVATGGKGRTGKIIFSIIIGGALLATGIGGALGAAALPGTGASLGLGFGLGASSGFLGLSYGTIALMGAGILLGGLNMLLTPTPKDSHADQKKTSFTFDGPVNAGDEGLAIPILYGELIVGGVTIASDIRSGQPASVSGGGGIGGGGTTVGRTIGGGTGSFSHSSSV
jgi:predicted phage tail protein